MKSEIASEDCWESLNDCPFRLREGLRFRAEGPENDFTSFLEDSDLGRSYVMSKWQRWFIELIESKTPARDAARLVIGCFPDQVSREGIVRFINWLNDEEIFQKVPTYELKAGRREEKPNLAHTTGIRRFRMLNSPFLMNSAAVALIAVGVWSLKPSLRYSSSQPEKVAAVSAIELGVGENEFASAEVVPIRATSTGVLTDILVRDGDTVSAGDVLARIEDPIAVQNLQDLKRELGESRVRRDRYYRKGDLEKYNAELHRIADFSRRIGSHQADVTLAEMRAPIDGRIETEVLRGQIGVQVARGDVLLFVHPRESELLAGMP